MGWSARLQLNYRRDGDRTVAHDRHEGPLRVLASLHPEGPAVCHHVIVHPPGGIVGGDTLATELQLAEGAHALLTTPGATRFYRSAGDAATQTTTARLDPGARLEWLPLETICHPGAQAANRLRLDLAPGAEAIGWDVLALGLPAAAQGFDEGRFTQEIELPGVWLERGTIDGRDTLLLDSPLGFAGHRVVASAWFAAGTPLGRDRREALLAAARDAASGHELAATFGATSPHARLVLLRLLAHRVEPAMALLAKVWGAWREAGWQLAPCAPRVWRT